MTFTDTELNEIELRLRETASILRDKGYCDRNFGIDDKAADAIAQLRKERRPRENILREVSSEWDTTMNTNEVTCHSRMIEGVLCRWWGDGPTPKGVAVIDAAATEERKDGN